MADFTVILAYVLLIGIPMLILGFGSMAGDKIASRLLALVNFISILIYYTHENVIPGWVAGLFIMFLAAIFVFLFRSVLGENAG